MRRTVPLFLWLLIGILALYGVVIGSGDSGTGALLRLGLLALLVIAAIRVPSPATRRRRAVPWAVATCGLAALLASGLALWLGSQALHSVLQAATSVLIVGTTITVIVTYLLKRLVVDVTTVLGVLCTYLLLALFFAGLHQALGAYDPHYVNGAANPATSADLLYFSVITLTTVGFGDITPASSPARAVTVVEALLGQVYLVSVVAGAVGAIHGRRGED